MHNVNHKIIQMDSLTKRLMSRSGLWHADPMLPPVHNMRMVYTDKPLTDDEIALHDAKKALRDLEDGLEKGLGFYEVQNLEITLNIAMNALNAQREYFGKRYVHTSKVITNAKFPSSPSATEKANEAARQAVERNREAKAAAVKQRQRAAERAKQVEDKITELQKKEKQEPDSARKEILQKQRQHMHDKAEAEKKEAVARNAASAAAAQQEEEQAVEAAKAAQAAAAAKAAEEAAAKAAAEAAAEAYVWSEAFDAADKADTEEAAQKAAEAEADRRDEAWRAQEAAATAAADADKAAAKAAEAKARDDWYDNKGWLGHWDVGHAEGDGDCLLHSLCHIQEPRVPDCHIKTRKRIIAFMRGNPTSQITVFDST